MISFSKYKAILWDFDGVLMDSMAVRDRGFATVLSGYPADQVARLMEYHHRNGGLSRYVKFRYFFEEIRGESIDEKQVKDLAGQFSEVMMQFLVNAELLINDSLDFVKKNYAHVPMHVVSGSDGVELNTICTRLDIAKYFVSVHGSPTPKIKLVDDVLKTYGYLQNETVLIGDSVNDEQAAVSNSIDFAGYNNPRLDNRNRNYILSFSQVTLKANR